MWFMCRWLSSRRRRSTTPADCIQQQQQRSQEQQQGSQQSSQRPKGLGDSFLNPDHRHYDSSNRTPTMDGATDDEDGGEVEGLMLDTETDSSRDCSRHGEAVAARGAPDVTDYGGAGDCSLRINAHGMERDEGLREQLAMVEAMVQEMKVGFMAALEQLSSMQDAEQGGWQKVDGMCKQHDTQIVDIATSLDALRQEVSTLSSNVGKVIGTQQSLKDQLNAMQTSQQRLMDELVTAGVLSEKSRTVLSQLEKSNKLPQVDIVLDNISGDLNNHGSSHIADAVDFRSGQVEVPKSDKTGVTAAACKSLSLIQALAARCQDVDISDSSEEDLESSPRRKHGEKRRYKTVDSSADLAQRQQAVQDIVESEQEYCTQLWSVVNCYQRPLQEGHYMSSRHLCVLFPAPISELCEQHSQMLHSLQDRLVHWSYAGLVGDVFARITDSNSNLLGLYQEYVESLPASISCLRRQRAQSRNFRAFIKTQREANADMDLLSLLISPLQRIPKYMLQLQQVLCHTHEDHPDYFNLQASLSKLQDFVERFSHDITHTIQATALDLQHLQAHGSSFRSNGSGSSCEILPVTTSTRDSGIHSAEDTFPRRKRDHDMYLPNWLEHSTGYHHTDSRHGHAMGAHHWPPHPSRLASHSQPDLTYTGYSLPPSPFDHQGSVPQIRSQSTLPPSGDRSARQRRYKIKKRIEGQGRYLSQTPSPQMRPASAIDFVSQREPQQRPEREHAVMRPHSVLGPFPGNGRSRVIQVYSRKQMSRGGGRQGVSTVTHPLGSNSQHQARTSSQPNINGHWDSVAAGDTGLKDHGYGQVDYTYDDDNEDDTRAMSGAPSMETSSSHKLSSRHSQDAPETETDNSEDYTPEDLAASLSHHLTGGPVRTSSWTNSDNQQLHYLASKLQVDETDNDTDYLESLESGVITTDLHLSAMPPQQQPFEDMSELRLDLTCFHDDSEGHSSVKKSTPQPDRSPVKEPSPQPQVALNMQPMAVNMNSMQSVTGNVNNNSSGVDSSSLNTAPQNHYVEENSDNAVAELNGNVNNATPANSSPVKNSAAYSTAGNSSAMNSSTVNSAPKPVNTSLSTDTVSWDQDERKRTLPAAKQDLLPSVSDTNSRVIHMDFDRPPLRRSATPQEHLSNVHRPIMLRSATPSEYVTAHGVDPSLSLKFTDDSQRRNKDTKHTSAENLHRSVEDVSTVSKKKHFRTSLKNLFNRKKGSVVLDELEREYTKELVRQCLMTKNGHTHTPTATHPAEAPTTNITTNDHSRADGVETSPTRNVCGHDSSDTGRDAGYGVDDTVNNNNNNNNSVLHCNNHSNGFFTKMRKSPLFFLYRNTADGNTDTIV